MSDDKEVALIPRNDFTMKDIESIEKFKEDGLLGLAQITDLDVERSMALYVDGKTYRQIANILKINKTVILFLANKFNWFDLRVQYLQELQATLPQKVLDSKLQSQEFFLKMILAYQKKIGSNVDRYLRTNDEQWFDKIDGKDLGVLVKITELLHKLNSESFGNPNGDKSLVALNGMGDGVTITKTGTNSVEITPKSPFSSKLKQFADLKRQQERDSQLPPKESHDIVVEQTLTQEESENKENE